MLHIGLTGGIASGKSTVAKMFAELGAALVDTDLIARQIVKPGMPALNAISETFGESVIREDGSLDRAAMRKRIFSNATERYKLEAIMHPPIRAQALRQIQASQGPYVIIAVPLLVETNFAELVDRVVVVKCAAEQQIARVIARDRIDRAQAEAIISSQVDDATRLLAADDIIDNSGSLDATRARVGQLHLKYQELAKRCRPKQARAE